MFEGFSAHCYNKICDNINILDVMHYVHGYEVKNNFIFENNQNVRLMALFNIVEERLKKLLNFDVCVV